MTSGIHESQMDYLLRLAKASVVSGFHHDAAAYTSSRGAPQTYQQPMPGFVSLWQDGELRGCIGSTNYNLSLFHMVRNNAFKAGFRDLRYPRLGHGFLRYGAIQLHLFVKARGIRLHDIAVADEVIVDGESLTVSHGGKEGTLLAYTQAEFPTKEAFMRAALLKAGIPGTVHVSDVNIRIFETQASDIRPFTEIGEFDHEWN